MASGSSAIRANPGSFVEASSLTSSMNPQKALDQCIARLWKMIIQTQGSVYGIRMGQFSRTSLQELSKDSVVTKCGHLFDRANFLNHWKNSQEKNCPYCRSARFQESIPAYALQALDQLPEDFIPICSKFKKPDLVRAQALISIAKDLIKEEDFSGATKVLSTALEYTNSSEDYSIVPRLYDAGKDSDKASLSRLYLSLHQLLEWKIQEAIKTLSESIVNPVLLAALEFHVQPGSTQDRIRLLKNLLEDIKETEDKIFLCQQILTLDPFQFGVHEKLIALTVNPPEKRRLCLEAAVLAKEKGDVKFEEIFLKKSSKISWTWITKEQWMNADKMDLPSYPPELEKFLEEQDPNDPTKTKRDTHIVVPLFPDIMDENGSITPLTLESLDQLDKDPDGTMGYDPLTYLFPAKDLVANIGFRYGVMTKDVIPGSRGKTYAEMESMLPVGYRVPKILDAARAILWENRRAKIRPFRDVYTRCSDCPITKAYRMDEDMRVVVGRFDFSSLGIYHYNGNDTFVGIAGWREF